MKVSNYNLHPSRTLGFRRLSQSETTARLALEHPKTAEAIVITRDSIKFNPLPTRLETWDELERLAPPYNQPHKPVSTFHWLYGDNPHMIQTVGGGMFPIPDHPDGGLGIHEAIDLYDAAEQAALQSRAKAATEKDGWAASTFAEMVFAGIAAVSTIIVAVVLLPKILESF